MFEYDLHKNTKKHLLGVIDSPGQGYIFSGPSYSYKQRAAQDIAIDLAGATELAHPNILQIEPGETGSIKIGQIKELLATLAQTAYFADAYRVVIILEAHTLTADASNALLKALEEPGDKVVFILVTDRPQYLLSTVQSRLQRVLFMPVLNEGNQLPPRLRQLLLESPELRSEYDTTDSWADEFMSGSLSARFAVAKQVFESKAADKLVARLETKLHATVAERASAADWIEALLRCEDRLQHNLNPRLCLEELALEMAS